MHDITAENTYCMIIDVQEKLFPHVQESETLAATTKKLIDGLRLFDVPVLFTQQYTKGLGPTIPMLGAESAAEKTTFSCYAEEACARELDTNRPHVICAGIETHICVQQTALDLQASGYRPIIVADCVSSRKAYDKTIALDLMRQAGIRVTTYESLLFAICKNAKHEKFRELSKLVK